MSESSVLKFNLQFCHSAVCSATKNSIKKFNQCPPSLWCMFSTLHISFLEKIISVTHLYPYSYKWGETQERKTEANPQSRNANLEQNPC